MSRESSAARRAVRGIVSTAASLALALALVPAAAFADGDGETGAGEGETPSTEQTYKDEKYESGKWKTVYIDGTDTSGETESAYTGTTDDAKMETELKAALENAGLSEAEKTTILLTKDVQLSASQRQKSALEISGGIYASISSTGGTSHSIKSGGVLDNGRNAGLYMISVSGVAHVEFANIKLLGGVVDDEGTDGKGNRKLKLSKKGCGLYVNNANAVVTLEQNAVIERFGDSSREGGMGAWVAAGTLQLATGSLVTGCTSTNTSGVFGLGVYVTGDNAKLVMDGGTISSNTRTGSNSQYTRGGGINVQNGAVFEMNSGKISDNEIYGAGAGVYLSSAAVIGSASSEAKAEISGNKAYDFYTSSTTSYSNFVTPQGGGIYYSGSFNDSLTLNASALIENNVVESSMSTYVDPAAGRPNGISPAGHGCGAGLYVYDSLQSNGKGATVEMNGGTIKGNEIKATVAPEENDGNASRPLAYANGGGVYLEGGTFNMKGGSIESNKAAASWSGNKLAGNGGGVYAGFKVTSSGTSSSYYPARFTMSGGEVKDNTATGTGNGIYVGTSDATYSATWNSTAVTPGPYITRACNPTVAFGNSGSESTVTVGDGVYLPADATDTTGENVVRASMSVAGPLSAQSSVAFDSAKKEAESTVVAVPLDEDAYAIHLSDAQAFKYADENFVVGKNDVGNLVLYEKSSATSKTDLSGATVALEGLTEGKTPYAGKKIAPGVKVK